MYAVLWQQVLKRIPLTVAFANKAILVVWGVVWGKVVFNEAITIMKVLAIICIVYGIGEVVRADE